MAKRYRSILTSPEKKGHKMGIYAKGKQPVKDSSLDRSLNSKFKGTSFQEVFHPTANKKKRDFSRKYRDAMDDLLEDNYGPI
jgi:hypothetical protein